MAKYFKFNFLKRKNKLFKTVVASCRQFYLLQTFHTVVEKVYGHH